MAKKKLEKIELSIELRMPAGERASILMQHGPSIAPSGSETHGRTFPDMAVGHVKAKSQNGAHPRQLQ
jgi:hypothetical protein